MTVAIIVLLAILVVLMLCAVCLLAAIYEQVKLHTGELSGIRLLQLNPRTRVSQAEMGNTPPTRETELTRLGRSTQGRRTVVGGEDDSQLKRDLVHGLGQPSAVSDE